MSGDDRRPGARCRPDRVLGPPRGQCAARPVGGRVRGDHDEQCIPSLDGALHDGRGRAGDVAARGADPASRPPPRTRKTLAEVCLILNIEDTHLANYAIRKLTQARLLQAGRKGKEKTVRITDAGAILCARYKEVREALLVRAARQLGHDPADISRIAALLRALSGSYDQAARAAAAL